MILRFLSAFQIKYLNWCSPEWCSLHAAASAHGPSEETHGAKVHHEHWQGKGNYTVHKVFFGENIQEVKVCVHIFNVAFLVSPCTMHMHALISLHYRLWDLTPTGQNGASMETNVMSERYRWMNASWHTSGTISLYNTNWSAKNSKKKPEKKTEKNLLSAFLNPK